MIFPLSRIIPAISATLAIGMPAPVFAAEGGRPNVLFVIVDDANPYANSITGDTTVPTPNLERLAKRSAVFTRGYVAVPACAPSRAAFLTGVAAHRSGAYYNNHIFRDSGGWLAKVDSLPHHFKTHGYTSAGYGKVFHFPDKGSFSTGHYFPKDQTLEDALLKHVIPGTLTSIPGGPKNYTFGELPDDWDLANPAKMQQDTLNVDRSIALFSQKGDSPFFIACGIFRPHVSWTVPRRYFARFPLDKIQIPASYKADDLEDLSKPGRWSATRRGYHDKIVKADLWRRCIQAHYASVSYMDDMVGRLLDALEKSPANDNTYIVFISDNGFHLGEKNHWSKFALWEIATKVPFMISGPGVVPGERGTPVSTLDIYPTLIELCGLPKPETHELDGISLAPVLKGRSLNRGRPVLTTHGPGNHALRDERYRYIRYRNGDEELYDHTTDEWEWRNLASDPANARLIEDFRAQLPKEDAPNLPFAYGDESSKGWSPGAFEKDARGE